MAVLITLALVIITGTVAHRVTTPQDQLRLIDPGELTVATAARGDWRVGGVTVHIDGEGLVITEGHRTVWASPAGESFVTGADGDVTWDEHRGYFWPDVRLATQWGDQSIDAVRADGASVTIGGRLSGAENDIGYTLTVSARSGGGAVTEIEADGVAVVGLASARSRGAGVHGLGAQFAEFDLDGRLIPIVTREQGVGRGLQPLTYLADVTNGGAGGTELMTYAAWSTFVTDDLRGLSLDPDRPESHAFAIADTRDGDSVGLQVWAPRLRAELTAADSPAELITAQQSGAARPGLADWTQHGAIIGLQGGTDVVRAHVAELTAAGTDVSAVWLQDWTGQRTTSFGDRLWWTWQHDQQRYPGWADLVADLRKQGIRTTTYVNPFLTDAAAKPGAPVRNLWAEARDAGYLVRTGSGDPYELDQGGFSASLVDLTNADARQWFAQVIAEEVLADGVDGFMADFAEGLPFDAVLADGDARLLHNRWPGLWAETVAEACRIAEKPDCVTWFRSGSLGMSQDAALFWTGDQLVGFGAQDGLESALRGTLSAGVSGWPLVHSDIGGYTSINAVVHDYVRPDDLLERWAEYAAFGMVMRTHEGNRPRANAQVYETAQSRASFARMTRVFAALAPYREVVLEQALRSGLPAIRHGWLVHPGTAAAQVDTQFFLGDAVLVAPVLTSGADSVDVTFPPGRWVHLITGDTYEGDRTVTVSAPLGTPAVFARVDDPRTAELRQSVQRALR
ncbi:alpha-glucosidase [Propionibacteriaceae bacterium Y1700]|uniref:alpha-glucosidase n=1 Tax=Microlunatus sp. Y1700 TaxID=3418487 RepID=UPI003DA780B5